MKLPFRGAIDCDLHPAMPGAPALLSYLDEYWRDQIVNRHIDKYSFVLTSYPPNAPLSARPDWRQASGAPAGDLDTIRRHALDPFGTGLAICNVLHGALALFNEDMAAALCTAVNDWAVQELLDREPRLRASILVPAHNPVLAVKEIERRAPDRRFVQVLLLAMGEMLLGRRVYWPIYAAAEKHGLAIGIHAGSTYHPIWAVQELIDREPRLRASILVPAHNPVLAVKEIERRAPDRRFVQVLLLAMGEMLLGRRVYWPIYAAAEKHGLAIGIHAGSTYHHAPMPSGWPAHRVEDYVAQSTAFESQVLSFLTEGVFQKFPTLRLVLLESGITWLPTLLWRTNKTWHGVRTEVPWIDRPPAEIVREHVRLTLQPVDVPCDDPRVLARVVAHAGCEDMLLFSTDYPHWHFDGEDVLPDGLPEGVVRKLLIDNPLEAYPRLRDGVVADSGVLRDNAAAGQEAMR